MGSQKKKKALLPGLENIFKEYEGLYLRVIDDIPNSYQDVKQLRNSGVKNSSVLPIVHHTVKRKLKKAQ